jgi:hypothetical protein
VVGNAVGPPDWLQLLVLRAVLAGLQVLTEGVDSAGPDPIGSVYFELARSVLRLEMVVACQAVPARKRLIPAGDVLLPCSLPGLVRLFPLLQFFSGIVQQERRVVGSALHCLLQSAALQNSYFGLQQGYLKRFGPVLPGERGEAEHAALAVVAPVLAAEPAFAVPASISKFSRRLMPAVPGGIPIVRIQAWPVAPGSVAPARILSFPTPVAPA